ncbi:MAG: hypothetical protein ACYDB7_09970 [Mycobacteriales bacterium]
MFRRLPRNPFEGNPAEAGRQRRLLLAAGLVAPVLSAACGLASGQPGVAVVQPQSNVNFGLPSSSPVPVNTTASTVYLTPLPGAPLGPAVPNAPAAASTVAPLPNLSNQGGFTFGSTNGGGGNGSGFCPGPSLSSQPPNAPGVNVVGEPKSGYYLWQVLQQQKINSITVTTSQKYADYQVTSVSPISSVPNPQPGQPATQTFTFDVVEPLAGGLTETVTYQVKQNAPSESVVAGNVGKSETVSEPDAGVAIAREIIRNARGATVFSFNPTTAVLILPLPVNVGAQFTGSGTDPTTGEVLTVSGQVGKSARVATCSGYVQAWQVVATVTATSGGGASTSYSGDFGVENQAGGLVVLVSSTPTGSSTSSVDAVGNPTAASSPPPIPSGEGV